MKYRPASPGTKRPSPPSLSNPPLTRARTTTVRPHHQHLTRSRSPFFPERGCLAFRHNPRLPLANSLSNLPQTSMKLPKNSLELPSALMELPSAQMEPPFAQMEAPSAQMEPPFAQMEPSFAQMERPFAQMEPSLAQMKPPFARGKRPSDPRTGLDHPLSSLLPRPRLVASSPNRRREMSSETSSVS
jgi:hypothetical protein